jgi:hypothetical protein
MQPRPPAPSYPERDLQLMVSAPEASPSAQPPWALPLVHELHRWVLVLALAIGLAASVLAWTGRVQVAAAEAPAAKASGASGMVPAADYRRDEDRQVAPLVSVRFDPVRGTRVARELGVPAGDWSR